MYRLVTRLFGRRLLIAVVLLAFVFLIMGGVGALNAYAFGVKSYSDYIYSTTYPFAVGFVLTSFFGFLYFYRNRQSSYCLFGLLIIVAAYGCLEVLFNACGGA